MARFLLHYLLIKSVFKWCWGYWLSREAETWRRAAWFMSNFQTVQRDAWCMVTFPKQAFYDQRVCSDKWQSSLAVPHFMFLINLFLLMRSLKHLYGRGKMSPVIWEMANWTRQVVDFIRALSGRAISHCSPHGCDPMRACTGLLIVHTSWFWKWIADI